MSVEEVSLLTHSCGQQNGEEGFHTQRRGMDGLCTLPERQPLNLVSIFGPARQGKSFLMNCISGYAGLFTVSGSYEPCTSGVNVSTEFPLLSQLCRRLDHPFREFVDVDSRIGFLDLEGSGDKGRDYDVKLVLPMLLTSHVVIFNWVGRPNKSTILGELEILEYAGKRMVASTAQHVRGAPEVVDLSSFPSGDGDTSDDDDEEPAPFGHLFIVLQNASAFKGKDNEAQERIFAQLMEDEPDSDGRGAQLRNEIRRKLVASFESVNVRLLDDVVTDSSLHSAYPSGIPQRYITPAFQKSVHGLRADIVEKLTEPRRFAGRVLTGITVAMLVRQVTQLLNDPAATMSVHGLLSLIHEKQISDASLTGRRQWEKEIHILEDRFPLSNQSTEEEISRIKGLVFAKLEASMCQIPDHLSSPAKEELQRHIDQERSSLLDKNHHRQREAVDAATRKAFSSFDSRVSSRKLPLPVSDHKLMECIQSAAADTIRVFDEVVTAFPVELFKDAKQQVGQHIVSQTQVLQESNTSSQTQHLHSTTRALTKDFQFHANRLTDQLPMGDGELRTRFESLYRNVGYSVHVALQPFPQFADTPCEVYTESSLPPVPLAHEPPAFLVSGVADHLVDLVSSLFRDLNSTFEMCRQHNRGLQKQAIESAQSDALRQISNSMAELANNVPLHWSTATQKMGELTHEVTDEFDKKVKDFNVNLVELSKQSIFDAMQKATDDFIGINNQAQARHLRDFAVDAWSEFREKVKSFIRKCPECESDDLLGKFMALKKFTVLGVEQEASKYPGVPQDDVHAFLDWRRHQRLKPSPSRLPLGHESFSLEFVICGTRGKNLPKMDLMKSNPYLVLQYSNSTNIKHTLKYRTKVDKRTLCPAWSEQFCFPLPDDGDVGRLHISCWNRNKLSKDKYMGSAVLPIEMYVFLSLHRIHVDTDPVWLDLRMPEGYHPKIAQLEHMGPLSFSDGIGLGRVGLHVRIRSRSGGGTPGGGSTPTPMAGVH